MEYGLSHSQCLSIQYYIFNIVLKKYQFGLDVGYVNDVYLGNRLHFNDTLDHKIYVTKSL